MQHFRRCPDHAFAFAICRYLRRHWLKGLSLFLTGLVFFHSGAIISDCCRGKQPISLKEGRFYSTDEDCYRLFCRSRIDVPPHTEGCRSSWETERYLRSLPIWLSERRRRMENTDRLARMGQVELMIMHAPTRTAYCEIPKSACTFWVSVFRFMNNDTGGIPYAHPLAIPRVQVHSDKPSATVFRAIKQLEQRPPDLDDYFRFIFVRNPYNRIWSSYIDKFFLLDFWPTEVPLFLTFWKEDARSKFKDVGEFGKCGQDVSFAEFLTYVAARGEQAPWDLNIHWRPVEHLCGTRYFCPHFVGHVETFRQDAPYVLQRMNMSWMLNGEQSLQPELYQMGILVDDNFRQLDPKLSTKYELYANCTNVSDIARRLQRAFQMYGYLPNTGWTFPQEEFDKDPTAENFKGIVFEAYKSFSRSQRKQLVKQREEEMELAFRTVPVGLLERISQLYLYEFLTFDYEMRPTNLLRVRYES